jgi:ABC-2 type transport system permease protein
MTAYLTLTRRELAGYFLSVAGYVVLAAVMFLIGFSFVVLLVNLRQEPTAMPLTEIFYQTDFFWFILLLATPVITMRLFALEKSSGTYETLMTTPVTDVQVVLAKFSAALVFYIVMWLPLVACLWVVQHYTNDRSGMDIGALGATFLGIVLLGAMFVALGCCASALTRSQVTAAMISLVFGGALYQLSFVAGQIATQQTWQARVLRCFALLEQMHDFARGIVDSRPVVFLASMTLFFLFLALRIVESRRWK